MKEFSRIYIVAGAFLVWLVVIGFFRIIAYNQITHAREWVEHTYRVIEKTKDLQRLTNGMIGVQRGYLLSGDSSFVAEFKLNREKINQAIIDLTATTSDNPVQTRRLIQLQSLMQKYIDQLEIRLQEYNSAQSGELLSLTDNEAIMALGDQIDSNVLDFLQMENNLLEQRLSVQTGYQKSYQTTFIVMVLLGIALIIVGTFWVVKQVRSKEEALSENKTSQQRLHLALLSSSDGIWDWNLVTNQVFFSNRYAELLGYEPQDIDATLNGFNEYLDHEEKEKIWSKINNYLQGGASEYSQVFRMKHISGRDIWIHARGRALFNEEGKAIRLVVALSDISRIKESEVASLELSESLKKSNEAKSEFIAHISHEIRTPLTAIIGISQLLEATKENMDDQSIALVERLNRSGKALLDLLNEILDLAKIESGQLELHEELLRINEFIGELTEIVQPMAESKGLAFETDIRTEDDAAFFGDPVRLRQICLNLLTNAVKFTEQGGVTLSVELNNTNLLIKVKDTGIGIAAKNISKVFQKFEQADKSTSRKFGGTGLGLPISSQLAELMGGSITVESAEGVGSTFTLSLTRKLDYRDVGRSYSMTGKKNGIAPEVRKKKVLIVDDHEDNRFIISSMIDNLELPYTIVSSGGKAVNILKDEHFDIILMDVQMPEMDGFQTTTKIRRQIEKLSDRIQPKIIAITAHAFKGDKERCLAAGMDDYLSKPIDERKLRKALV